MDLTPGCRVSWSRRGVRPVSYGTCVNAARGRLPTTWVGRFWTLGPVGIGIDLGKPETELSALTRGRREFGREFDDGGFNCPVQ
jgi:hypothetical protein